MFCDVMVQGMSRDTWDDFSKTILMRYLLSYLCGTLYMDLSASLKRSLHSLWGEGGGGSFWPFNPCVNSDFRTIQGNIVPGPSFLLLETELFKLNPICSDKSSLHGSSIGWWT